MKTLNKILIASTLAFASMGANADLVATDWQTTGDSLATLDEATGIEWLDLTQTDGMSINQVESLLSSSFAGWRLPTRSEVTQLMANAFPSQAENVQGTGVWTITDDITDKESDKFRSLFGNSYSDTYYDYSLGLFKNDFIGAPYSVLRSGVTDKRIDNKVSLYSNRNLNNDLNYSIYYQGVYLVSDGGTTLSSINNPLLNANNANAPSSVPLPATALLMGLGLTGLMRRKDKS